MARLLAATGLCRLFVMNRGTYRLRFHPSALAVTLWSDPRDRDDDHFFLRALLASGNQVIDVGANIGDFTLHAASIVGPSGRVYAVEPHPRTFRFLVENISLNKACNIVPLNIAAGPVSGTAFVSDKRSDDQNVILRQDDSGRRVKVRVARLDELGIAGVVHLIKIDTEGYERFVLEGAVGLFDRVEAIYFEASEQQFRRFGYDLAELLAWLKTHSFRVHRIHNRMLKPVSPTGMPVGHTNLVATRPAAEDRLRVTLPLRE
ncbi:MAG TPA: FkbM family methyltransferase [Gemmatimonadales bacterium]|nr:FkbM family methyltransferase [Gemmatimonadales bacterium]